MDSNVALDDDTAIQQQLGAAIKDQRTQAGLSQGALADVAGISRVYLNQVEQGRKSASVVVLVQLARAMKIKPAALLRAIS